MIIYSVTLAIDKDIEQEWQSWMRLTHIPQVMATGCFLAGRMSRLLDPAPEPGTATFNVQYEVENLAVYKRYLDRHAPALQKDHADRYAGKFVAFRTILRVEEEFEGILSLN